MVTGLSVLAAPAPAQASDWKCSTLGNGKLCLKTDRKDASHISAADVRYTKNGGACITLRYGHQIREGSNNFVVGDWLDNGSSYLCAGTTSFKWIHGGAGAYVPPGGQVIGYMDVLGQGRFWTPGIKRENT
jgi:hypothetical protein